MKIALDYDGTYTEDPELWEAFIRLCKERGHDVSIVTKRDPSEKVNVQSIPVIYSSRMAKFSLMPDQTIWIDNEPHHILFSDRQLREM